MLIMDRKGLAILILLAVILFLLINPQRSYFSAGPAGTDGLAGAGLKGHMDAASVSYTDGASAASLIPREVVQTEDYGQFKPDDILSGQNFLDPRSQIGYPETLGGVLRNANRQYRSEPINPRTPVSIFNLSTIPPDTMRPKFEIGTDFS